MSKDKTAQADPKPYQPPTKSETQHNLKIGLSFKAITDWLIIRKSGRPIAEMFYTYYASSSKQKSKTKRPVTFLFNGGPGAASAFLHVGTAGPWRVDFTDRGDYLKPPVSIVENKESWLYFSDLVFVDPVGTGFSCAVEESRNEKEPFRFDKGEKDDVTKLVERANTEKYEFFGVNRDIEVLVQFVTQFLSLYELWDAPIYLAGESYGGYRVGRLIRYLHEGAGVGLSGAILVSPALDLAVHDRSEYDLLPYVDELPTLALTASFHGKARGYGSNVSPQTIQKEAEQFATNDLSRLLIAGQSLATKERKQVLNKLADLLGLDTNYVTRKNGRVPFWLFSKELMREEGKLCGYYDASCLSIDPFSNRDWNEGPDHTATLESAFTSGINHILRTKLKVKTDRSYHLLSYEVFHKWRIDQERHFMNLQLNSVDDFRFGLAVNPFLKVLVAHGVYDMVTPYFASKRLLQQMPLTEQQLERTKLVNYPGGHMFYTWKKSRQDFTEQVAELY